MAGDWIKMRSNLWDDPRVGALVDLTESSEAAVIGGLYWLWATADQHSEDGCMPKLSMRQIDRKTGIPGFAAALVQIEWLTDDPQGVVILNFQEHNGATAKKRLLTAKRVANFKLGNAGVTQGALPDEHGTVSGALPRERDRDREEGNTPAPDGAGGDPPPVDMTALTKSELWKAGKSLLREQGMPMAQCDTFIGKLVKDHGEAAVLEAVQVAVVNRPAGASDYLVGVLREKTKPTPKTTQADRRASTLAGLTGNFQGAKDAQHRGDAIDVQARVVPGHSTGTHGLGGAGLFPSRGTNGGKGG